MVTTRRAGSRLLHAETCADTAFYPRVFVFMCTYKHCVFFLLHSCIIFSEPYIREHARFSAESFATAVHQETSVPSFDFL